MSCPIHVMLVLAACCWLLALGGSTTTGPATQTGRVVDSMCYNQTLLGITAVRIVCRSIGKKGSAECGTTQWLVDYTRSGNPVCLDEACPRGMGHMRNMDWEWDCDCKPFHAFWNQPGLNQYDGECHPVLRRGPCPESHLLVLEPPESGSQSTWGVCSPQPCPEGQYHVTLGEGRAARLAPQGTPGASCETLETRGGLCSTLGADKVLRLEAGELRCGSANLHRAMLSSMPERRCPRGARLVFTTSGGATCRARVITG